MDDIGINMFVFSAGLILGSMLCVYSIAIMRPYLETQTSPVVAQTSKSNSKHQRDHGNLSSWLLLFAEVLGLTILAWGFSHNTGGIVKFIMQYHQCFIIVVPTIFSIVVLGISCRAVDEVIKLGNNTNPIEKTTEQMDFPLTLGSRAKAKMAIQPEQNIVPSITNTAAPVETKSEQDFPIKPQEVSEQPSTPTIAPVKNIAEQKFLAKARALSEKINQLGVVADGSSKDYAVRSKLLSLFTEAMDSVLRIDSESCQEFEPVLDAHLQSEVKNEDGWEWV